MIPKINIEYNRFLDPIFQSWVRNERAYKGIIPSRKYVLKRTLRYKKLWQKDGEAILKALIKVSGLRFSRNQIEVHVVSVNPRSFSSPIVMKSRYDDVDFINTITHELIHCLFSDNFDRVNAYLPWDQNIKKRDTANDHVFLHAILKYIYLDVLKSPKHLKKNLAISKKPSNEGYIQAWNIVTSGSYMEIIEEFRRRIGMK